MEVKLAGGEKQRSSAETENMYVVSKLTSLGVAQVEGICKEVVGD